MPKKKPSYVVLTWHDSCSDGTCPWVGNEDIDTEPLLIASAGMVIKETKKILCIACATYGDQSMAVVQIPKSAIQQIKRLKFPYQFTQ